MNVFKAFFYSGWKLSMYPKIIKGNVNRRISYYFKTLGYILFLAFIIAIINVIDLKFYISDPLVELVEAHGGIQSIENLPEFSIYRGRLECNEEYIFENDDIYACINTEKTFEEKDFSSIKKEKVFLFDSGKLMYGHGGDEHSLNSIGYGQSNVSKGDLLEIFNGSDEDFKTFMNVFLIIWLIAYSITNSIAIWISAVILSLVGIVLNLIFKGKITYLELHRISACVLTPAAIFNELVRFFTVRRVSLLVMGIISLVYLILAVRATAKKKKEEEELFRQLNSGGQTYGDATAAFNAMLKNNQDNNE